KNGDRAGRAGLSSSRRPVRLPNRPTPQTRRSRRLRTAGRNRCELGEIARPYGDVQANSAPCRDTRPSLSSRKLAAQGPSGKVRRSSRDERASVISLTARAASHGQPARPEGIAGESSNELAGRDTALVVGVIVVRGR